MSSQCSLKEAFEAVKDGDVVEFNKRFDPSEVNECRMEKTLLFVACVYKRVAIIELLLNCRGINVNKGDNNGCSPLILACRKGNLEIVKLLLKQNQIDANKGDQYGTSPLIVACRKGHFEIVKLLLKQNGIDINKGDNYGDSPLIVACIQGHLEIVKLLLEKTLIDVNKCNNNGSSPLILACREGNLEIVKLLLKQNQIDVNKGNNDGNSPLIFACDKGHLKIVQLLTKHTQIDVNKCDGDGNSPLTVACYNLTSTHSMTGPIGSREIVKLLLKQNGIDVNKGDNNGCSPLIIACRRENLEIVKLLLENTLIDVNKGDNNVYSPLYYACIQGNLEIVKLLLENTLIDVNKGDKNGNSPLIVACDKRHLDIVKLLLNNNEIDVNKGDNNGNSPLIFACDKGHLEIVKLLLENNEIDINTGDNNGDSPLIFACDKGHSKIVKLLLKQNGIDVNKCNNNGNSPLILACDKGHLEIVKLLLKQNGIDVNKCDGDGDFPLIVACDKGHLEIVKLLLENNEIDVNKCNGDGKSPLIVAIDEEHSEIVKLLFFEKYANEKKRKQSFISTDQVFHDLCSLNEKVTQCRQEVNSKFNLLTSFSSELEINMEQYEEFSNIRNKLNSCTSMINEKLTTSKFDIENNEHTSHVNNIMVNITTVVETINSEQYLIKLNQYFQILEDKLQKFDEFIETYLNQDDLQNIATDKTKVELITSFKQILEGLDKKYGNSKYKKQSQEIQQLIQNQLQNITTCLSQGKSLEQDNFSSNLMDAMEQLEKEHLELEQQLSSSKCMIPEDMKSGIYQIYINYQNQSSIVVMLIQETIPFIIEKHEQLQNIVNVMNNYKELSGQFTTLQRKKPRLTRELNGVKLDIDGLKEELQHVTNTNELADMKDAIKEKEKTLVEKKITLKECIDQANEIKLKFLPLKTIGFDMQSILKTSIASNLNIEEMSPELFKEIKPIHDFVGNHHLFIGIDINDKKHVIKQYTIKDKKKLENLQKELKITTKLKHNNIIAIEGFYMENNITHSTNNVYIAMPFYSNGNLKEFIEKQRESNKLDLVFWERTWRQLLIAIQHIHSKSVIHCDIKPENIFVGELNNGLYPIILGDFDISLDVQSRTMNLYTRTSISGTFDYLAPELMNGQSSATFKSDMFAFGKTIKNCMTTQELTNYSSLNNLVEQCLKTHASERPYASDALVCEFFLNETLLDEIKVQQAKSRQLNMILPSYWKMNTFESFTKRYYFVDTKHLQDIMQEIINISCNSTTLGKGRDQKVEMNYSKLIVSSVVRIENSSLFTSFKSRMNHLASYQDPLKSIQVQTENTSLTSKSFEWMKTVGLNSSMNEKYLWHGTKPEYVQTIAEHGFDERVASLGGLFGAGVYFAEYCSKSDQYCTPDQNDEYTLLLCRVVLGRQIYFTPQQMNNQRRPPEINNSNKRVYDSVIGQSNSTNTYYRELIVYDRYQCYPEYIIKYKRQ